MKPSLLRPRRCIGLGTLTLAAALACATGCEKEDTTIRVYNAPKEQPSDAPTASALPPAMASAGQAAQGGIEWTLPAGWEKEPPRNMIYAAFRVSKDDPKAECTVSTLQMRLDSEPGLLLQNVVRWEGQVHLPASSEADLPKLVKDVDLPAGKAQVVDLIGPDPAPGDAKAGLKQHMIVYLVPHEGATWFLKLTGSVAAVEAQKSNFEAFAKSVKFPAAGAGQAASAAAPADGAAPATAPSAASHPDEPPQKLSKWVTPAGWKQDEKQSQFRDLSFQVASDDKPGEKAEVSVSRLPGENADVLGQDINMWRGQVGLEPLADYNGEGMTRVQIAGKPAALFEFAGPKADKPEKRVIVAMVLRGGDLWFFKIAGPTGLVQAQKPTFISFVNSVEFTAK